MEFVDVLGTIKLEPPVIKLEPPLIKSEISEIKSEPSIVIKPEPCDVEVYPDYVIISSVGKCEDESVVIGDSKVAAEEAEHGDDNPKSNSNNEKVDWGNIYRTHHDSNCLEEQKKVKKIYDPTWKKPIEQEEYTYISKTSIICNYCRREFTQMKNLGRHIRILHRQASRTYQCPYCPKQSKWDLKYHILTQHKDETEVNWFQCYDCGKKCRLKSTLIQHIDSHLGKKGERMETTCTTCLQVFVSKRSLRNHVIRYHEKKHQCGKCSFTGQTLGFLKKHIEVHHTEPKEVIIYQCDKCDFKTRHKPSYTVHCKKHEATFVCDKCSFVSESYAEFNSHVTAHKKQLQCKNCDYITDLPYKLQLHEVKHLKPEEINYLCCYHCGFKAKRRRNLRTHVIRHFEKEEVTLQCFICDFDTNKRDALTEHINLHQKTPQIKKEEYPNKDYRVGGRLSL